VFFWMALISLGVGGMLLIIDLFRIKPNNLSSFAP
jgi:hypothetical protein